MIFLADECIDNIIVKHLREAGHTIWFIQEMDRGIPDDEVLELASQKDAILLTVDTDFGELVYRKQMISTGVILIRLVNFTNLEKASIVAQVIKKHEAELKGSFTVISTKNIRIRPLNLSK